MTVAIVRRSIANPPMLLVALFGWLSAAAWLRPLALPDEGRYVGVAWEMLRSGNWLVPTLNTLPYFHKPPLFYWLTAASLAAFGLNEWAARLPSLLAATGAAFALFLFARRWLSERHGELSLLILATTPFFFGGAQFANLDMLVAAFIACTILAAADAVLDVEDGHPRRLSLAAAYAFAALGVLAKGLIGVVIPALVMLAWLSYLGRAGMLLRLVWLPGIALFALIVVPWFLLVAARYPNFLHYFFIHHHLERFSRGDFNSPQPFWFYIPVFAGLTLPWIVFLPRVLKEPAPVEPEARNLRALMWVWLIATLVFFSIPKSKLVGYVLVAVVPMAVLVAQGLLQDAPTATAMRSRMRFSAALAALVCGAALAGGLLYERNNIRQLFLQARPLIGPLDEIVALRTYPFSLAFYLKRSRPIPVVEDWDAPLLLRKDTWRKELFEAASFVEGARIGALLLKPQELGRYLACARHTVWVVSEEGAAASHPAVAGLERVASVGKHTLRRSPPAPASGTAAGCP